MYKKIMNIVIVLVFLMMGSNRVNATSEESQIFSIKLTSEKKQAHAEIVSRIDPDDLYTIEVENTGKYPLKFAVKYYNPTANKKPHLGGWSPYKSKIAQPGKKKKITDLRFNKGVPSFKIFFSLKSRKENSRLKKWVTRHKYKKGAEGTLTVYRQK